MKAKKEGKIKGNGLDASLDEKIEDDEDEF